MGNQPVIQDVTEYTVREYTIFYRGLGGLGGIGFRGGGGNRVLEAPTADIEFIQEVNQGSSLISGFGLGSAIETDISDLMSSPFGKRKSYKITWRNTHREPTTVTADGYTTDTRRVPVERRAPLPPVQPQPVYLAQPPVYQPPPYQPQPGYQQPNPQVYQPIIQPDAPPPGMYRSTEGEVE